MTPRQTLLVLLLVNLLLSLLLDGPARWVATFGAVASLVAWVAVCAARGQCSTCRRMAADCAAAEAPRG